MDEKITNALTNLWDVAKNIAEQTSHYSGSIAQLQAQCEVLIEENSELTQELHSIQQQKTTLEQENNLQRKELKELEILRNEITNKRHEIIQRNTQISDMKEQIAFLRSDVLRSESQIANIQSKLAKLQTEEAERDNTIIERNNEIILLTAQNISIKEEIDNVSNDKVQVEASITELKEHYGKILDKIDEAIDEASSTIESLTQENKILNGTIKKLNEDLAENETFKSANADITEQIQKLLTDNETLRQKLIVQNKEVEIVKNENGTLNAKIQELKLQLEEISNMGKDESNKTESKYKLENERLYELVSELEKQINDSEREKSELLYFREQILDELEVRKNESGKAQKIALAYENLKSKNLEQQAKITEQNKELQYYKKRYYAEGSLFEDMRVEETRATEEKDFLVAKIEAFITKLENKLK